MVRITRVIVVALSAALLYLSSAAAAYSKQLGFEYLSPLPGSAYHLPETNIILRPGGNVDAASVDRGKLRVRGEKSGSHHGRLRLSDDRKNVLFQPDVPFAPGEVVICDLDPGLVTETGEPVPPVEFTFTIAGPEREALRDFVVPEDLDGGSSPGLGGNAAPPVENAQSAAPSESLPPDFPHIQAAVYGTPTPGRLFLCNFVFGGVPVPSYLMILENDGTPFFRRRLAGTGLDFKMQPGGRLTYFDSVARGFYALNARYDVVDSFRCGNGYTTDGHDLLLLPNGHSVLMSYDPQVVDLSTVVKGGRIDAIVIGLIIQELDQERNVVFQWRSWDHFQITDIVSHSLASATVDYVHGNSVDVDPEGNFIISSRHMNEVTKISRDTGEMLWRMGGRNNQFTFINEAIQFSHQHDVRRLPNGNLTLFDNGNFRLPLFSRAVEYAIDEAQKTATLVWQYRLNPDVFGAGFGSVQRFSNGNTLIGWGATTPTLTEVAPDGSIVSELTFDHSIASYRAFRFEWPPVKPAIVEIQPAVIGLGSRGGWVVAVIRPEGKDFSITDIDPSTLRLNGTVPADTASANWANAKDGVTEALRIPFDRNALLPLLTLGSNRIEVSGSLTTGEIFRGFAEVFVGAQGTPRAGSIPASVAASEAPRTVVLEKPVPNPSHGSIRVRLGLPREGPAEVSVFDLAGRLVARVSTEPRAAGWHDLRWDGRDRNGRPVASGVYFVRLGESPSMSRRFVVLR
jgi:arylsulfotransferase ASST/flagellar hook capping protein FlgD